MQSPKKTETTAVKCETSNELQDKIFTDYTSAKDSGKSLSDILRSILKIAPCYPNIEVERVPMFHNTCNDDINTSVVNEYSIFKVLLKNMHLHTDEDGVDFIYMDELYKDNDPELHYKLKELIERNK